MNRNVNLQKTILPLAIITFVFAAAAWAEDPVDAYALFDQFQNRKIKWKSRSFTNKADFVAGANEVIDAMKNNLPVHTTFSGLPSHPRPWIDQEFGIEMNSLGCGGDSFAETINMGRRAALLWYADRGAYPVNSTKPRKPLDAVPKKGWKPLVDDNDSRAGMGNTSLILNYKREFTFLTTKPINLLIQWYWSVPAKEILWSHHKSMIWLDIPERWTTKPKNSELKEPREFIEIDPSTGQTIQIRDADGTLI